MAHAASNDSAGASRAFQQNPITPTYVEFDSEIQPISTVGLAQRARFGARLVRSLRPSWPCELSMSVTVVYIVREKRVRAFMRWSAAVDPAGAEPKLAERRAVRHLDATFQATQEALATHYGLSQVGDGEVTEALGDARCHLPLVELRYASWPSGRQWLAPTHAQPVLDYLEAQQGCGALAVTVERMANLDVTREQFLRLSVVAMGEATNETALRLLTNEFRGCGVLAASSAMSHEAPALQRVLATTAEERAYISRAMVRPWALHSQPPANVTLTSAEAGLLLPLPMPLYAR